MSLKRLIFEKIKEETPNWVSEIIIKINKNPNYIFGREYKAYFKKLKKTNGVNPNLEKDLIKIVNFSIKNIPYYNKKYGNKIITSIDDFKKTIEPINKQIVLDNLDDFIINKNECDLVATGGTSGKSMNIYLPKNRYITELATLHYAWGKIGYKFSSRAVIRNTKLSKKKHIINPLTKEYIFDGFKLNDEYFEYIYNIMKSKQIHFLHGYTSNLFMFGKFLIRNKKDYSFIKGLFTSSENVTELMNDFFKNRLKIPHINFYGHTEKLVFGAYCEKSTKYHIDSFYGYTEILDENDQEKEFGEITGTTLHNFNMPLLRYRTGDFANKSKTGCKCKYKDLLLENIIGRWNGDKIYNRDNSYVTTTALNLHSEIYSKINGIQYIQEKKGVLNIHILKGDNYSKDDERLLLQAIKSKLNPDTDVHIVYPNQLEKKINGKFLLLISNV